MKRFSTSYNYHGNATKILMRYYLRPVKTGVTKAREDLSAAKGCRGEDTLTPTAGQKHVDVATAETVQRFLRN